MGTIVEVKKNLQEPVGYLFSLYREPTTTLHCRMRVIVNSIIEKTTIVRIESTDSDFVKNTYYGVVEEIYAANVHNWEEFASSGYDDKNEGDLWAKITLLGSSNGLLMPPLIHSPVYLATEEDAKLAYSLEKIKSGAACGVLRSGAHGLLGKAIIDLDFLLGANGAHANITGMAGVATKSSAMLTIITSVADAAKKEREKNPSSQENVFPVPVIFSGKGYDLMHIKYNSKHFNESHKHIWNAMGIATNNPFADAEFWTPASKNKKISVGLGQNGKPYSWTLKIILEEELFEYLFSDIDNEKDTFQQLVAVLYDLLTDVDTYGARVIKKGVHTPKTFNELLKYLQEASTDQGHVLLKNGIHPATIKSFYRRLQKIILQANGVLSENNEGSPPKICYPHERDCPEEGPSPIVIDIYSLGVGNESAIAVQRFVVAAILKHLEKDRLRPTAQHNVRYLVCLDELHRFAPIRATDPITRLIEYVAAEMRSIGIILIGAQQQASLVSTKVLENASIKLIGHTGMGELSNSIFDFLSEEQKIIVSRQQPGQMMLLQPVFQQPANIIMPFPIWAMRNADVLQNIESPKITKTPLGAEKRLSWK